jgi:hypothetical protein
MHLSKGVFFDLNVVLGCCLRDGVCLELLVCPFVCPQLAVALVLQLDPVISLLAGDGQNVVISLLVAHSSNLIIIFLTLTFK